MGNVGKHSYSVANNVRQQLLRCPHIYDVRFLFTSSCLQEASYLIYDICVCLRIVVYNVQLPYQWHGGVLVHPGFSKLSRWSTFQLYVLCVFCFARLRFCVFFAQCFQINPVECTLGVLFDPNCEILSTCLIIIRYYVYVCRIKREIINWTGCLETLNYYTNIDLKSLYSCTPRQAQIIKRKWELMNNLFSV